jgi:hypothetical protein
MEGFNAFYFSFITLSTVGYGDITPVSKVARTLAAMEAISPKVFIRPKSNRRLRPCEA